MSCSIKIGHLFPDILNMYGDKGNIASLVHRMKWRDIDAEVLEVLKDDEINLENFDIVLLSGGSEKDDCQACELLKSHKDKIKAYVENGGVMLATCGGFTMLGNFFMIKDEKIEGLSVMDMESCYDERFIGNIVIETEITGEKIKVAGFENHAARTDIKNLTSFGNVLTGSGNNGKDKTCGVVYKNLIGTYIHGPLLPKNPEIADYIIKKALEKKYNEEINLIPLDDTLENEALDYSIKRFSE